MKACTDVEQSKELAKILPLETADMRYTPFDDTYPWFWDGHLLEKGAIPCWSLAALLGVMPKGEGKDLLLAFGSCDGGYHPLWFRIYEETPTILEITRSDDPIDACVEMIFKLKENNLL